MTSTSTTHNYFLAQTKSLEFQLKITQLKLSKVQALNRALQQQLQLKQLEIFRLTQTISRIQQKPKHIKLLKAKVEQLEKDFHLEIESVIKSAKIKPNSSNHKFNSTLPFGDSFSESSRGSQTTFDMQKFERNSMGNQLDILEEAFHSEFESSDDLKNILFKFIKNVHQGCNIVILVESSKALFGELRNYLKDIGKLRVVNEMVLGFLAESKDIFGEEESSDNE